MNNEAPLSRSTLRRQHERALIQTAQEEEDIRAQRSNSTGLRIPTGPPEPALPTPFVEPNLPSNEMSPGEQEEYEVTKSTLLDLMAQCREAEENRPLLDHLLFASPIPGERYRLAPHSARNNDYLLYKEYLRGLRIDVEAIDDLDRETVRDGITRVIRAIDYLEEELEVRVLRAWDIYKKREEHTRWARDEGIPVVDTSESLLLCRLPNQQSDINVR